MSREIASAYFHISNGGVTFKVVDDGHGPTVVVESSQFGNNNTTQQVHLTQTGIKVLARLFQSAAEHDYSKCYCHAAEASKRSCRPVSAYDDLLPDEKTGSGSCGMSSDDLKFQAFTEQSKQNYVPNPPAAFSYATQLVDNEELFGEGTEGRGRIGVYQIANFMLNETLTGTIFIDETPIQKFVETDTDIVIKPLGVTETWVEEIVRDGKHLCLKWNRPPGQNKVVVEYECAYEDARNDG